MTQLKVRLHPIVNRLNLPTVLKTALLPGDSMERLFIATQVGEIFFVGNGEIRTFLDIRSRIIELGGYDERGLLGLAFHPQFNNNGLFYLHYSVAGTQGPGALPKSYTPDPCDPKTLSLKWTNRDTQYDHIDTVEEWILQTNGQPQKRRTILNLRRPFSNHNGVNSLQFSPETGKLVLTTGDGGSGYDPFNLSQDAMEICGKIIEIDVNKNTMNNPPVVSRFNELPVRIQETLTVTAKGVRNILGITYQRYQNQFIKYVGNVGQELVESIFSFVHYKPIPVTQLVDHRNRSIVLPGTPDLSPTDQDGFINLGWRGWEGDLPTTIIKNCNTNEDLDEKSIAFYQEAIETLVRRIHPLTSYYHQDPRTNTFKGTALTGVQVYMGNQIPALSGSVVFTDFARKDESQPSVKGALAYTRARTGGKSNNYQLIDTVYDFGSQSAYFVSLGTNLNQTRLYLGTHGSMKVTDYNKGTVFEIVS
ncbi:PQQ-dependent sugar dehydrogenase [Bacillus sinesaloumensis]|uniref:PQQ-dependent sugar dehydrogenase n=1 Tax=Litchfieldia sinesaloumensis TaxID=1926280 RepID=UPI0009885A1E|nr:PQQ-dependent sugar dehydrogenase [Bacillus sinesaloumensis]